MIQTVDIYNIIVSHPMVTLSSSIGIKRLTFHYKILDILEWRKVLLTFVIKCECPNFAAALPITKRTMREMVNPAKRYFSNCFQF